MKTTVSLKDFLKAFENLQINKFSKEALVQLFNHLEEFDPQMELNVIDLCRTYCELSIWDIPVVSYEAWDEDVDSNLVGKRRREQIKDYLNEKTTIVGFTNDTVIFVRC